MRHLLFICSLFFFSSFTPGNHEVLRLKYEILQKGQKIGEIYAKRTIIDNQVYYDVSSEMTIKVVGKQIISYNSQAVYKNEMLMNSQFKSYINNKTHKYCNISWKGNRYEIKSGLNIETSDKIVKYSGLLLYFKEPFGITHTFSEMTGTYNRMNRVGEHEYTLTDNQTNKTNRYWYQNGILSRAFIDHTFIDIELRRVN